MTACLGEERVIIREVEDLFVIVPGLANVKDGLDIRIDKPGGNNMSDSASFSHILTNLRLYPSAWTSSSQL